MNLSIILQTAFVVLATAGCVAGLYTQYRLLRDPQMLAYNLYVAEAAQLKLSELLRSKMVLFALLVNLIVAATLFYLELYIVASFFVFWIAYTFVVYPLVGKRILKNLIQQAQAQLARG